MEYLGDTHGHTPLQSCKGKHSEIRKEHAGTQSSQTINTTSVAHMGNMVMHDSRGLVGSETCFMKLMGLMCIAPRACAGQLRDSPK